MATSTLLLNASYEPLRVISSRRAVVMVLDEKAEVLEEGADPFRSETQWLAVPEVIRLRRFVQVPFRARIPLSSRAVRERDGHECAYCEDRKGTTVDHIQPRSRGGRHDWLNVVAACRHCNSLKDDHTLAELTARDGVERWALRFQPFQPTGTKWLLMGLKDTNPVWAPYLEAVS